MAVITTDVNTASHDQYNVPSLLIKDAATWETIAVTNWSGAPSTSPSGSAVVPLAEYNAIPTTRTEGQFGVLQQDSLGNLKETLGTTIAGEDIPNDVTKVEMRNNATYISTATTTVCKTGAGLLHSIVFQGGTAGTVIGYDNTAASGTILFSFDALSAIGNPIFDVSFSIGLTVVTAAATKLTVSAR